MALWVLPNHVKQVLKSEWETYAWKDEYLESVHGALNYMMSKSASQDEWNKHLGTLTEVDGWRGENIRQSLSELFAIIEGA
jgi:hypothetical protein